MAYTRRYSSGDFDFDGKDPGPGGFYFELFDSGKVMVGWGRNRTKWVKLDQAEVVNFLTNAASMVVTDDPGVKDTLGQLAKALAAAKPLTFEDVIGDDELLATFTALIKDKAHTRDEALAILAKQRA